MDTPASGRRRVSSAALDGKVVWKRAVGERAIGEAAIGEGLTLLDVLHPMRY